MNSIRNGLGFIINFIHIFIIVFPLFIFFIKKKILDKYLKLIILFYLLIPIHWFFIKRKCILNIVHDYIVKPKGNYQFTDSFFGNLIKYFFNKFNIEYNENNRLRLTWLVSLINIFLLLIYYFYF